MMKPHPTTPEPTASSTWERVEEFAHAHVQRFIQALLEEEVTELLGRTKSTRREAVDKLKGAELLPAVYAGVQYRDSVKRRETAQQKLAA